MARLNEACESFIASLEKAQAELQWVANRLEEEFAARSKGGKVNSMDLITRIHRLRHELPAVTSECAEVLQAKQECVDAAKRHLLGNCEALAQLQRRAGISVDDTGEEAKAAFETAVQEFDSKLRVGATSVGYDHLCGAELSQVIAQSVVT